MPDLVQRKYDGTAIICGTGPSITPDQIRLVNASQAKVFSCNRAWEIFRTDVLHACNHQFWDLWWDRIKDQPFEKWTTRPELEGKYPGLRYIPEKWEDGLSTDPSYICAHHGTGPQAVNLAFLYGCTRLLLVGWDMTFGPKKDPKNLRRTYVGPRRYLGEDELTRNHWPMTGPNGEMHGLIREMETIHPEDYGIEIINCSPGSAMKCFPMMDLEDALKTS